MAAEKETEKGPVQGAGDGVLRPQNHRLGCMAAVGVGSPVGGRWKAYLALGGEFGGTFVASDDVRDN